MAARTLLAAALLLGLCAAGANAMYSSSGPVVELTDSNLKAKVKAAGIMLVEFYAPWCGHCKALKPAWEQTASALKGIVAVGAIDADAHRGMGSEYRVQGFPTIKLLYVDDSSGSIKSVDYNGGRAAKDLVNWALDKARNLALKRIGEKPSGGSSGGSAGGDSGSCGGGGGARGGSGGAGGDSFYSGTDVVTLTSSNFDSEVVRSNELWLVEFYAPWCGHCKNLKPAYIEAASELKGRVKLGAVDCTAHQSVCSEYGVQGYPTIKFFGEDKTSPEDYRSGRDSGSIVAFCSSKHEEMVPPAEPEELTGQHVFEQECLGDGETKAKKMCLMVFLPNLLDSKAAGRNRYVATLKKLAEAYKGKPYSYLWAEGGVQEKLEANFGVGGFGYPAVVAFTPTEKKFAVAKAAFEFAAIKEWIDGMRLAGAKFSAVQGQLAEVTDVTPWDGQDAKEEAVDEFSLDDLMNDEL